MRARQTWGLHQGYDFLPAALHRCQTQGHLLTHRQHLAVDLQIHHPKQDRQRNGLALQIEKNLAGDLRVRSHLHRALRAHVR
ncbi:MAG: hypothetical protein ACK56I_17755, partial [bacterium]